MAKRRRAAGTNYRERAKKLKDFGFKLAHGNRKNFSPADKARITRAWNRTDNLRQLTRERRASFVRTSLASKVDKNAVLDKTPGGVFIQGQGAKRVRILKDGSTRIQYKLPGSGRTRIDTYIPYTFGQDGLSPEDWIRSLFEGGAEEVTPQIYGRRIDLSYDAESWEQELEDDTTTSVGQLVLTGSAPNRRTGPTGPREGFGADQRLTGAYVVMFR